MNMKRFAAIVLMVLMCVTMLVGCSQATSTGQDITICMGPDPKTIDPALNASVDGSTMLTNAFSGLYGFNVDANGKIIIVADCAKEIVKPTALDGGKFQYVITLKDGLKWSDGVAMKASDFTYAWNRAVDPKTAADYQYIFDVIDGYDAETPALNIQADDAKGTVTVVTRSYVGYFDQLMAFPTFFPVRKDIVDTHGEAWATKAETYISNGAFRVKTWTVGDSIVMEKNPNYWNTKAVKLNTIKFALSDDDSANFSNFENDTFQLVYNVDVDQIQTLKDTRLNKDFIIGDYIGTYFLEFNIEQSLKPGLKSASKTSSAWSNWTAEQNAEVRHALSLLIDRNYIVEKVAKAGQMPADGFVPKGMDDGTGTEFRSKAQPWWSVKAADYQANCDEAVNILKKYYNYNETTKKFTNFPSFEYSINTTSLNKAICQAVQDMWAQYGITTTVDQRTWSVIQTALVEGDFTMSRLGWIADYNDPVNYMEIHVSSSGNNHPRFGKSGPIGSAAVYGPNKNQTWADAFDAQVDKIKTTADMAARAELMYKAEQVLRDTYAVLPIFFYTNPYLVKETLKDYIYSPLGWVSFKFAHSEAK